MKTRYKIPDSVCAEARKFIKSVVKTLTDTGVIESIDSAALDMLARSFSMFLKASGKLENQELTIVNRQGNTIANPLIKIMKDAQTSCMQIMTEFGLTAKSRKKLPGMDKRDREESPLDEFVRKSKEIK